MSKEDKIEAFLRKLPKETVAKIKKLKFYENLVLINRRNNYIEEVETGKIVKKADWDFTLPELTKILHVSRSWLYANLQSKVKYIYINNLDLESMAIFYDESIGDLRKYRALAPIHLNTNDVIEWFNSTFYHGKRSIVIDAKRIFGDKVNEILLDYGLSSISHLYLDINNLSQFVLNEKLWNLCLESPELYRTSKYPIVPISKPLTATELKSTDFYSLREYTYSADGMREILTTGADIYKSRKGKNSKMLFTFSANEPFDVTWVYQELCKRLKNTNYPQRAIDDTITYLQNIFVVPAVQYIREFPNL